MGKIWGAVLFAFIFNASTVLAFESHLPVPHYPLIRPAPSPSDQFTTFQRKPVQAKPGADAIATELKRQLDASMFPLTKPAPACASAEAAEYTLALEVSGKLDECAQFAKSCTQNASSPRVLTIGAACEVTKGNFSSSESLYRAATSTQFQGSVDFAEAVFRFATYAMVHLQAEVPSILKLNSAWNDHDREFLALVIRRVSEMDIRPHTKPEVDAFLNQQIGIAKGGLAGLLKQWRVQITLRDAHYTDALNLLVADMSSFPDPLWYYRAYGVVYRAYDQQFAEARKVYDAFDPYANWTWDLPTEDNTYNYTEIYGSVCVLTLLQGQDQTEFTQFKEKLRRGEVSPTQALSSIENFVQRFPGKADVLTTYAGILALLDRHDDAIAQYWKAHRACRYYNRANWGMELEQRRIHYTNLPDYAENAARVERELGSRTIPAEISSYIVNWNSLSPAAQRRAEYGARIWLPYMKPLLDNQFTTYIKFAFDLLSESPNLSSLKDQRIGGAGYPNDNRLWDDVRGVGGETVVADLGEMFESVQGEYNLLGHEMTHQFQGLLEQKSPVGIGCVENLYAAAKARGTFPDFYAAQNKEEYFAQGVTYYLVPSDSPARFGLNQSWLTTGDPALLGFIQSIEAAAGDLTKISCQPMVLNTQAGL